MFQRLVLQKKVENIKPTNHTEHQKSRKKSFLATAGSSEIYVTKKV